MTPRRELALPSARSTRPASSRTAAAGDQEALPGVSGEQARTTVAVRPSGSSVVSRLTGGDTSVSLSVDMLPAPYDVPDGVLSPLSEKERTDLELCEQALHGFRKALIVAGKALEIINRARLYRETHATFADYVWEVWGFKRAHAYRLIEEWPIAVAVSPIGDINEAQARELLPVWKDHGPEATVVLFKETKQLAGEKQVTAAALAEARKVLPPRLAAPEQAADVLRVAAAEGRVPLIAPPKVKILEQPTREQAPTGEDVLKDDVRTGGEAIAVLEAALAQQQQIYDRLAGVVSQALMYDPGRAEMLLAQLRQYANRTAYRARGRAQGADAD